MGKPKVQTHPTYLDAPYAYHFYFALNTTVANGGSVIWIEAGRPCDEIVSAATPGAFPMFDPA